MNDRQNTEYPSDLNHTEESDFDEEAEEYYESDESANLTWISWFCSLKGHEYFCEIPEEYIEDEFNLTGLSQTVNYYVEALDMILDIEDDSEEPLDADEIEAIDNSSEILYGLIHARYIITRGGLQQMADKYENGDFGSCPRYACDGTFLAPCGRLDIPERESVKLFCPSCLDIYNPPSTRYSKIDGAYFGTTFAHLFFQAFPTFIPENPTPIYTPQIYGFAINERSKSGPRMQWLRMRPENIDEELDEDIDDEENNSTDSQSYVEAHAVAPPELAGALDEQAATRQPGDDSVEYAHKDEPSIDAGNEHMDVGTDRIISGASTPAGCATKNDDQDMASVTNSPKQSRPRLPADDARRRTPANANAD
ncbi:casein kinase 2 regulatory subunit [Linderina pennispora]|nr:casein kinase 2 regulatory subunit [Linderina pennispora]